MRYLITFLLLFSVVSSCKKGEHDPFFSIYSRKYRLSGQWEVTQFERKINDTTQKFNGSNLLQIVGSEEIKIKAVFEYDFEKNGKYSVSERMSYPEKYFGEKTPEITRIYTESGIWSFTGGAGDTKKKSQLLLRPEKMQSKIEGSSEVQITTYQNPMNGRTYDLDMLRNKTMRWKFDEVSNTPYGKSILKGAIEFKKVE